MNAEQMDPEQLRLLIRAEVSLESLNEWAEKLQNGSEEVLAMVSKKVEQLSRKIKLMSLKACTNCGNKSYLKDDECPYCGITN